MRRAWCCAGLLRAWLCQQLRLQSCPLESVLLQLTCCCLCCDEKSMVAMQAMHGCNAALYVLVFCTLHSAAESLLMIFFLVASCCGRHCACHRSCRSSLFVWSVRPAKQDCTLTVCNSLVSAVLLFYVWQGGGAFLCPPTTPCVLVCMLGVVLCAV